VSFRQLDDVTIDQNRQHTQCFIPEENGGERERNETRRNLHGEERETERQRKGFWKGLRVTGIYILAHLKGATRPQQKQQKKDNSKKKTKKERKEMSATAERKERERKKRKRKS
jgi:hypothetical protein